jgi:hypothetical protein
MNRVAAQAVERFGEALPEHDERQRVVGALDRQVSTI